MGDDKQAKQDKELIEQLDSTMISLWNSTMSMEAAADACKFQKGEVLYDRIGKCEAAVNEWDQSLTALQSELTALKKLLDGYPTKYGRTVSHSAEISYDLGVRQQAAMKLELKQTKDQLQKHKATLRKVKT